MKIPAHKVVGDVGKPGQHVYNKPEYVSEPQVQTLGDYLTRKKRYAALDTVALEQINAVKKLTFEEWWEENGGRVGNPDFAEIIFSDCWKAAQENV